MPTAAMNGTGDNAMANDADIYHQGSLKRQHQLEVIKTLGEGTHGKVVLATDPTSMQQVCSRVSLEWVLILIMPHVLVSVWVVGAIFSEGFTENLVTGVCFH